MSDFSSGAALARYQLAAEHVAGLRHPGTQLRQTRAQLTDAVKAYGTSLTGISGAGPVIAALVIGDTRVASRDAFAARNGTAPIEVSSGNRRHCHAIHMAAVTQIRHPHSDGRACYDKKIAEGKTSKQALRCLKRRISNAIYAALRADARTTSASTQGPGEHPGNDSASSATGSHPTHQLFGPATPEPEPHPTTPRPPATCANKENPKPHLTTGTKRTRYVLGL